MFASRYCIRTNFLVSASTNGLSVDNLSYEGALSANGRFVAFTHQRGQPRRERFETRRETFSRARLVANTTASSRQVAVTASGNQAPNAPTISADGR